MLFALGIVAESPQGIAPWLLRNARGLEAKSLTPGAPGCCARGGTPKYQIATTKIYW